MKIPATDKQVKETIYKLFVKKNTLQEELIRNVLHDWLMANMEEWLIKNKARAGKLIWAGMQDKKQAMPVMEEQLKLLVNTGMNTSAERKQAGKKVKHTSEKEEEKSLYCKITQIQKILAGSYADVISIMYTELRQVIQETKRQAG